MTNKANQDDSIQSRETLIEERNAVLKKFMFSKYGESGLLTAFKILGSNPQMPLTEFWQKFDIEFDNPQ